MRRLAVVAVADADVVGDAGFAFEIGATDAAERVVSAGLIVVAVVLFDPRDVRGLYKGSP